MTSDSIKAIDITNYSSIEAYTWNVLVECYFPILTHYSRSTSLKMSIVQYGLYYNTKACGYIFPSLHK